MLTLIAFLLGLAAFGLLRLVLVAVVRAAAFIVGLAASLFTGR